MDFTYDGTEKLKVEFGAREGCSISGIWVDLHQYRGDELKEAVSRGYIEVDRDRDHIVSVTGKINEYKLTVGQMKTAGLQNLNRRLPPLPMIRTNAWWLSSRLIQATESAR